VESKWSLLGVSGVQVESKWSLTGSVGECKIQSNPSTASNKLGENGTMLSVALSRILGSRNLKLILPSFSLTQVTTSLFWLYTSTTALLLAATSLLFRNTRTKSS
jgi:hypothetical protein